jgi:hypothetical protein
MVRNPIALKAIKKFADRDAQWIDAAGILHFRYQAGALDLRLALVAGESMPTPLALPCLRVAHVDDDGPMTGRAFAQMALHFDFSLLPVVPGESPVRPRSEIS